MVDFGKGLNSPRRYLVDELYERATRIVRDEGFYTEGFAVLWMSFNGWSSLVTECETDKEMIEKLAVDPRLESEFTNYFQSDGAYMTIVREFAGYWPLFSNMDINLHGLREKMEAWYEAGITVGELMKYDNSRAKKDGAGGIKGGVRRSPKNDNFNKDVPSWKDALESVYMVRCNLVHGTKGLGMNDSEIIKGAYETLSLLISAKKIYSWS